MILINDIDYIAPKDGGSEIAAKGIRYFCERLNPTELLEKICLKQGCDLDGANASGKYYLGQGYKLPIRIGKDNNFWIPVYGLFLTNSTYLSYRHIDKFNKSKNGTIISFFDGLKLEINIGVRSLNKQMRRCHYYNALTINSEVLFSENEKEVMSL